jgi:hypothetical protein
LKHIARVLKDVELRARVVSMSDTGVRELLVTARALAVRPIRVYTDLRGRRWEIRDPKAIWRWR